MKKTLLLVLALALCWAAPPASRARAAPGDVISLPPPLKTGGIPVLDAIARRKSFRAFQGTSLSPEQLSTILWTAFGVSREDGRRTIPSFHGRRELAVYAVLGAGVYLYDAKSNNLTRVLRGDRTMDYGGAPLTLLYAGPSQNGQVGGFHAGSAYQGVALYCASEGLANVVKVTGIDVLINELKTENDWPVLIVQSVGLPAGEGF
ncbi:MAG: nitroreductase family protein [Deltaproteobacteria bacterium]|jgi:hypothetical protein|nr:nitroreductase family protein [Deltaproteobacteria bacterium]